MRLLKFYPNKVVFFPLVFFKSGVDADLGIFDGISRCAGLARDLDNIPVCDKRGIGNREIVALPLRIRRDLTHSAVFEMNAVHVDVESLGRDLVRVNALRSENDIAFRIFRRGAGSDLDLEERVVLSDGQRKRRQFRRLPLRLDVVEGLDMSAREGERSLIRSRISDKALIILRLIDRIDPIL